MSRLRANQITNENANGAPNFPHGLTVTGIVTATTINQTPTSIVVGSAVTANSQGIDVTGVVTATSYRGNGSQLTGISVDPSTAASSAGFLKVLNASTPQIRLNNDASDGATTRAFFGVASGSKNYITGSVANDTVLSGRVAGDLLIGVGSTIRMRIDELGRVTKPNNVSFMVKADSNQAYSGGSIFVCNSPQTSGVCHNIGGHFNTSTGVFKAPVAGRYYLSMDTGPQFLNDSPTIETPPLTTNGSVSLKVPFLILNVSPATDLTSIVKAVVAEPINDPSTLILSPTLCSAVPFTISTDTEPEVLTLKYGDSPNSGYVLAPREQV